MSLWIHELRNAINAACTNTAVVKMLLEQGETERARQFNAAVLSACEKARMLMENPPEKEP